MTNLPLAKVCKPNSPLSKMTLEEKTLYELNAVTLWALVSGCYPFGHKESFYTIYTAFMRLIKNKDKIDEENYDWLPEDEKSADGKKPGLRIY